MIEMPLRNHESEDDKSLENSPVSHYQSNSTKSRTDSIELQIAESTPLKKKILRKTNMAKSGSFSSRKFDSVRSTVTNRTWRGRAQGKSGRISPHQLDNTAQRILSAKRLRYKELRSKVEELQRESEEIRMENRTLRRQSFRQEKALDKVDHCELEVPSVVVRHNEEVRSLREQIRRFRERYTSEQRRVRQLDAEVARVRDQLIRLKGLVQNRDLEERDLLQQKAAQLVDQLSEKDKKIQDLERHVENLHNNHRHELAQEVHRQREGQRTCKELQEKLGTLKECLKEKEKVLGIHNIYSQRVIRAPHRLETPSSNRLATVAGLPTALLSSRRAVGDGPIIEESIHSSVESTVLLNEGVADKKSPRQRKEEDKRKVSEDIKNRGELGATVRDHTERQQLEKQNEKPVVEDSKPHVEKENTQTTENAAVEERIKAEILDKLKSLDDVSNGRVVSGKESRKSQELANPVVATEAVANPVKTGESATNPRLPFMGGREDGLSRLTGIDHLREKQLMEDLFGPSGDQTISEPKLLSRRNSQARASLRDVEEVEELRL